MEREFFPTINEGVSNKYSETREPKEIIIVEQTLGSNFGIAVPIAKSPWCSPLFALFKFDSKHNLELALIIPLFKQPRVLFGLIGNRYCV